MKKAQHEVLGGNLTVRQVRREKEILQTARAQGGKNRTVPITLYWKILDAAEFALDNGYQRWADQRAKDWASDDLAETFYETEPIQ